MLYKIFINLCAFLTCLIITLTAIPVRASIDESEDPYLKVERELAFKYCQSIDKKLFEGLENELILKYEYFFSQISKDSIDNVNQFIDNFSSQVQSTCSIQITEANKKQFNNFFEKFYYDQN
tara:strand:+ start:10838 stop:11203 length:366 start_codon:yes stop_codon:yes gene_type:complete